MGWPRSATPRFLYATLLYFGLLCVLPATGGQTCVVVTELAQKRADCSSRKLTTVPGNLTSDIKVLKIGNNSLTYLNERSFAGLSVLQEVLSTGNRIEEIRETTFRPTANLRILILADNRLQSLPWESFQYLSRLRKLDLSRNYLKHIQGSRLQKLISLRVLNLSRNQITSVDNLSKLFLVTLRHLDVSSNRLKSLRLESIESLKTLRLYNNRWSCDCRIRRLHDSLTNATTTTTVWRFVNKSPECAQPARLQGVLWSSFKGERLACAPTTSTTASLTGSSMVDVRWRGNITLHCYVSGDPIPLVRWYDEDDRIVADSAHNRWMIDGLDFALTPPPRGSMRYRCTATNIAGRDSLVYAISYEEEATVSYRTFILVALPVLILIICLAVTAFAMWRRKRRDEKLVVYEHDPIKNAAELYIIRDESSISDDDATSTNHIAAIYDDHGSISDMNTYNMRGTSFRGTDL